MSKSTKLQILQCFSNLLHNYELDKITVTMLVDECKISRQTFYYHFSDIQALINWGIKQDTAGCLESVKSAKDIHMATSIYLNYIEDNRFFITKCMDSSLAGCTIVMLRNSVAEYIAFFAYQILKLEKSADGDAEFIIEFLSNAITGLVVSSIYQRKKINIEDITERMERAVLSKFTQ